MKENSATISTAIYKSPDIPARNYYPTKGGRKFRCIMNTAPCGTAPKGSLASSTAAAGNNSGSRAGPVAAEEPSAADAARGAAALRPSDYLAGNTGKQKPSSRPPYFSRACYRKLLLSFSSQKWFCPPPGLSPFLLARNGFRCTDTGTIECMVCGAKWTAHRGSHLEILGTLAHTDKAVASSNTTALSRRLPQNSRTLPVDSLAVFNAEASGGDPRHRVAEAEEETALDTQIADVHVTTPPATDSPATLGATGAAAGTMYKYSKTVHPEESVGHARQNSRDVHVYQPGMGHHVVKGILEQGKRTTGSSGTVGAFTQETQLQRDKYTPNRLLQEKEEVEKQTRNDQETVSMNAVALSFLHAECCPWRNAFISLTTIQLEGMAVHPEALIFQWTKRVQRLRGVGIAFSHTSHYPRLVLDGARAILLGAVIATAQATATAQAKARIRSGARTLQGQDAAKYTTSTPSPEQQAAHSNGQGEAVSGVQDLKTDSALGNPEASDRLEENSHCNGESCIAQFLSSPQSPLQAPCVSQLSNKEVQMLRQLWLFLATADGERDFLVRRYIPRGTVVPPVSVSGLLLERSCGLRKEQQTDKEGGECLSMPILDTLLRQVQSFLFDTRVPLPGCFRQPINRSRCEGEVTSPLFAFPKRHAPVNMDCDKLLAFFGWEPVTHSVTCKEDLHTAAAAAGQQQQPELDTTLRESGLSSSATQQPNRPEVGSPDTTHHAGTLLGHRERQSGQQQQVQLSRLKEVEEAHRDQEEINLAATSDSELSAQGRIPLTVLQCPYCFRCVELQKYVASEEGGCAISDNAWTLSSADTAADSQHGDETGVPKESAEGRQQSVQERGDRGAQTATYSSKVSGLGTRGEQSAGSSDTDSKGGRLENTERLTEEKHASENLSSRAGVSAAVIGGGRHRGCGTFGGGRCTSSNANTEVGVRQDGDGEPLQEDARGGRVRTSPRQTQADYIVSTGGNGGIRNYKVVTSTPTATAPIFDPVCAHRLHCPFISNAVYKDKLPLVLELLFSLIPVLVKTVQLQAERRRLEAEIDTLLRSSKRLQRSKQRCNDEK